MVQVRYLPLDYTASTELEAEGCAAIVAGVELVAIGSERASVMNLNCVSLLGLPIAFDGEGNVDREVRGDDANSGGREKRKGAEETIHARN